MIAAWQVRPPRLVTIAAARFITGSQFGIGHVGDEHVARLRRAPCPRRLSTTRTGPVPIFWPIARPSTSTVPLPLSL